MTVSFLLLPTYYGHKNPCLTPSFAFYAFCRSSLFASSLISITGYSDNISICKMSEIRSFSQAEDYLENILHSFGIICSQRFLL